MTKQVDLFSVWTPINIQKAQEGGPEEPLKAPIVIFTSPNTYKLDRYINLLQYA